MVAYVPVSAFAGAQPSDFLWFYNLNGVHHTADRDLASQAGYEEWRAVTGPQQQVPEGGGTLVMLGSALALLGFVARHRKMASNA